MEISSVIKKAMIDNNISSMSKLSQVTGVSYEVVKRVMSGKNTSLKTVDKILAPMGLMLTVGDKV